MNKRRFRKSLAQNAIYMKYKRVIPITGTGNVLFLANLNGKENTSQPSADDAVLMTLSDTRTAYSVQFNPPTLAATFDQNRCAAIKVKWLPSLPNGAVVAGYQPTLLLRDSEGIDANLTGTITPETLQAQINGVKTLNMYRPFKTYMKAPKHRINTRIPTQHPAYATPTQGYAPNENLAGQWKRTETSISNIYDPGLGDPITRGSHMAILFQRPAGLTGSFTLGNLEVTTYYVYKDRR